MQWLYLFLVIAFCTSCNQTEKVSLFNNCRFDDTSSWCIVLRDNYNKIRITTDPAVIKNNQDVWAKLSDECLGTTSDYELVLYKNGKPMNSISYCSFSPVSLGSLEKNFTNGFTYSVNVDSANKIPAIRDSLASIKNIYLLQLPDTSSDHYRRSNYIYYYQWNKN
jgi:hypothetical protein